MQDNRKDEQVLRKALTNFRLGHWFVDCRDRAVKAAEREAAKVVEREMEERNMVENGPAIKVIQPDEDGDDVGGDDGEEGDEAGGGHNVIQLEEADGQLFEEEVVPDAEVLVDVDEDERLDDEGGGR